MSAAGEASVEELIERLDAALREARARRITARAKAVIRELEATDELPHAHPGSPLRRAAWALLNELGA